MKGLLIKDFRFILSQKTTFIYSLFEALLIYVLFGEISILIIFCSAALTFFVPLFSLNYDETDNMSTFLLTLPITQKDYVKEKYLLYIIAFFLSNIFYFTPLLILSFVYNKSCFEETKLFYITILSLIIIGFIDVPFKLKIKYKTGNYSILISGIIGLTIMFANFPLIRNIFNWIKITDISFEYRSLCELLSLTVIALFVFYISYIISLRIIDKKEF